MYYCKNSVSIGVSEKMVDLTYVAKNSVGDVILRHLFKGLQFELLQLRGTQVLAVCSHLLANIHQRGIALHAILAAIIFVQIEQRLEESLAL